MLKNSGLLPGIFAIISFPPAPEHLRHIHRRLLQHLVTHVGVDVRRGLLVCVAYDLHAQLCVFLGCYPFFVHIHPLGKRRILVRL